MTDPGIVLDLIDAFRGSKAMFTAVSLGVFDRLPAASEALAAGLGVNCDALERLLDACVGLRLLRKEGAIYRNEPVADAYLRRSSPQTMTGYIMYSDRALFKLWANLEDAVREGSNRWKQTFGLDGPLFSAFFRTDEDMREFLLGMHGFGVMNSPRVVAAHDLSGFRRLVDLGGATGHLAMAATNRYPHLKVAVFDLPPVIENARRFVDHRVELIAGDFFTDELPEADLYSLGRILHDWNEPRIRTLLEKIHNRLPPGGALLIAEKLLLPDKSGPLHAHLQSLNMLVCTDGKERTVAEYETLLKEAGFSEVLGGPTGAILDAMLARKAGRLVEN
jgi:acetylserotonin N-methyltransferase